MRRRFTSSRFSSSAERNIVLVVVGAIGVAAATCWLAATSPGLSDSPGRAAIVLVLFADVAVFGLIARHQVARLTARLARADRDLGEAERLASVGRVAAGIAHEVGNPLTGISNYTHVLRARVGDSPDAETALTGIEREIERIDRIVASLLDYARPVEPQSSAFDAGSSLRAAVQLLSAQGVFRRVDVQSAIDSTPLSLTGNAHELEQAFVNLLLNAIDAMESHGTIALYAGRMTPDAMLRAPRRSVDESVQSFARRVHPRLDEWRAQHDPDAPCAKFVIADSGTGIDDDEADRIFDPFFTTKDNGEGTGLGLAIVQRIVDAHEGVVWAQRAREGGAAFHVVLPLDAFGQRPPKEVS